MWAECYGTAMTYFYVPEVVAECGCHSTEFRLTCRELEQQIVILDAFFTDNSNCTSAAGGAGTTPSTTTPSFFMVDENATSTALARGIREADILEKKQIRQPVKHRYVADYTDVCHKVKQIFVPYVIRSRYLWPCVVRRRPAAS